MLTELLFISLTEMFTQITSPFFCVCMVYCMCVGYTHLNMNTCAHPFVCTCEGQSRTLGVLLNYFLPHCLERRSPTELEVCCPSCVGCLVVWVYRCVQPNLEIHCFWDSNPNPHDCRASLTIELSFQPPFFIL